MSDPTPPADRGAPSDPGMSPVVRRNIAAMAAVRRREDGRKTPSDHLADRVTAFAGSMWCVYAHAAFFGAWLIFNSGHLPGAHPFDPFPFVMLAMITSVEAIFLSTFILISQNRARVLDDQRAELDLQVSLLAEHELTRAIRRLDEVAARLGVPESADADYQDVKRDVRPETVVEEITRAEPASDGNGRSDT